MNRLRGGGGRGKGEGSDEFGTARPLLIPRPQGNAVTRLCVVPRSLRQCSADPGTTLPVPPPPENGAFG